jgi:hypothetical protein
LEHGEWWCRLDKDDALDENVVCFVRVKWVRFEKVCKAAPNETRNSDENIICVVSVSIVVSINICMENYVVA